MAYRRYKKKARRYAKKASRAGFRKKNQGYMARSGRRAPLSSRGWMNGKYGLSKGAKPELKFYDTNFQTLGTDTMLYQASAGAVPAATTRNVKLCNGMAQGTDYNTRIGRKILIKSVYVRLTFQPETANTLASNSTARCILIWDLQPNSATAIPALSDFFEAFSAGTTWMNTNNMMNLNNRERFVILWDKMVTLGFLNTNAANGSSCRVLKKYKKVNLSVTYSATGAATNGQPNTIATGALWLVALGDAVTGGSVQSPGVVRIRYTDA